MTPARPLVLTLEIDKEAQRRFDAERLALFPPGRTAVGAHVTLFHALPGTRAAMVRARLVEEERRAPFAVCVTGVLSLGRGAAYRLSSPELLDLHGSLQQRWSADLTRQDAQPLRPHVTVQNKVSPDEAREAVAALRTGFRPFNLLASGLLLWRYNDGPWTFLQRFPFRGRPRNET